MVSAGTEWRATVVSVTDGDTLRVLRSRRLELDGRHYWLTDDELHGTPIRLMWVDTPERRDREAWRAARDDLSRWVDEHGPDGLRVVCYESGGWDRLMGDLIASDGSSASQWLMREGNGGAGWPAYEASS